MKKILACGVLTLAPAGAAGPAFAADDSNVGSGVNAANNRDFTAAATCVQEVAVVPVLGEHAGNNADSCANGNVLQHESGPWAGWWAA